MPLSSLENKIQVSSSSTAPLSFCCHETEPSTTTEPNDSSLAATRTETLFSSLPWLSLSSSSRRQIEQTNTNCSSLLFSKYEADESKRRRRLRCAPSARAESTSSTADAAAFSPSSNLNLQLIGRQQTATNQSAIAELRKTRQRLQAPSQNIRIPKRNSNLSKKSPISSKLTLSIFLINCSLLLLLQPSIVAAKSIEDAKANVLLANDLTNNDCGLQQDCKQQSTTTTIKPATSQTESSTAARSTLGDLFAKLTSAFNSDREQAATATTQISRVTEKEETTTVATTGPKISEEEEQEQDDSTGAGDDDHDAESCKGLSVGESAEGKNYTNNERLVNLQACLQGKVKKRLMGSTRAGMEIFERLSLGGGCSSSLMSLAAGLTDIKAYAFKFLDASAKIPSGVMYGLLSDFGDFDQCLSIRSNPLVSPENEVEERAFSGKYCLLSVKMNYHAELKPNETVPEGIYPDGILWDELMRNYWISNSTKGFQLGVCVPSRCSADDLDQIYRYVADSYNFQGQVMSCQDSNDLREQLTPDLLQLAIIYAFMTLISLSILGTLLERYFLHLLLRASSSLALTKQRQARETTNTGATNHCKRNDLLISLCQNRKLNAILNVLICFSLRRNWNIFINKRNSSQDLLNSNQWLSNEARRSIACSTSFSTDDTDTSDQRGHRRQQQAGDCSLSTTTTKWTETNTDLGPTNTSPIVTECSASSSSVSTTTLSSSNQTTKSTDSLSNANATTTTTTNAATADCPTMNNSRFSQQLMVKIQPNYAQDCSQPTTTTNGMQQHSKQQADGGGSIVSHLSGLKLIVIVWITIGHSFLYPSANNYQYYRSIININITRDSVWFATTNFTLGIDMLLYMSGLVFVYKLGRLRKSPTSNTSLLSSLLLPNNGKAQRTGEQSMARRGGVGHRNQHGFGFVGILQMLARKVLRFWPTYLSVIAMAIVIPLVSDGPMWPEMVQKRLGETCRRNFWANLLIVNNIFFSESEICLPSSWFVSVLMQLFLIGALIIILAKQVSFRLASLVTILLLLGSSMISFALAHYSNISAPVIRMDESFVLELDDKIFKLYTNLFNNLGPFLVGMIGGLLLLRHETQVRRQRFHESSSSNRKNINNKTMMTPPNKSPSSSLEDNNSSKPLSVLIMRFVLQELLLAISVSLIATCVLSSVFFQHYTRFWASLYWALHRIGWSIVTGYVVHQCATGKWKLLYDVLSLSTFIPLSKLVFIAYLVYPIYIHVHSGFVRDGLHVSIYNMLNIYVTRLVLTFSTALMIHLFVELPFCSLEEMFLENWLGKLIKCRQERTAASAHQGDHDLICKNVNKEDLKMMTNSDSSDNIKETKLSKFHPLLAVATPIDVDAKTDDDDRKITTTTIS